LNCVDKVLRGFEEEDHVLRLVSCKGKELDYRLKSLKIERLKILRIRTGTSSKSKEKKVKFLIQLHYLLAVLEMHKEYR
jgi:hypothetical protein